MSTTAYKLVDRDGYTRRGRIGETLWLPVGTIVSPTGTGTVPGGPGVLLPVLPLGDHIAWAICLAPHPTTRAWAVRWLSGEDRAEAAAASTAWAAEAAARAAARAASTASTVWAAEAAEAAAEAAAWAAAAAAFESRLMPILTRARAILAGEFPADRFDGPMEEGER